MKSFELRLLPVVALAVLFAACGLPEDPAAPAEEEVFSETTDALTSCKVTNYVPTVSNGRVRSRSRIWCPTTKSKLWVKTYLTRNNVGVAETSNTCEHNFECFATSSASNVSGSQRWCSHGNGQINDGTLLGASAACETASW
ncbi:MAG: hypothetical protein IPJ65_36105 [Archangiaceae bacterium]|nr:hypothetical protein [Archangiaceae bacterium]